ncbi:hypothetical protein NHH66_22780, partial [Xanthomonas campestris pv. campestris]
MEGEKEIKETIYEKMRGVASICGQDSACTASENARIRDWSKAEWNSLTLEIKTVNQQGMLVMSGYYPDGKFSAIADG